MRCPFCGGVENKVVDSRLVKEGDAIRRRRECLDCTKRFTTYERVEYILPLVIKRDGRREAFDRLKILGGVKKACEKRPISIEDLERLVDRIEAVCQERGDREIESTDLGERVMKELQRLDEVAYVRFASVYRQFRDLSDFMSELRDLVSTEKKKRGKSRGSG